MRSSTLKRVYANKLSGLLWIWKETLPPGGVFWGPLNFLFLKNPWVAQKKNLFLLAGDVIKINKCYFMVRGLLMSINVDIAKVKLY